MTETAVQTNQNQAKKHPLKNKNFFAIPKHLGLIKGMTDRLFRLMSVLCSAYGIDGHIEYKISTLARLIQKGERQTKDLINEARKKNLIETKQTGRSLVFILTEICFDSNPKEIHKSAQQRCGNPPVSYKEQKKELKETTTTPAAKKSPPEKPPEPIPKDKFVVVSSLKPLLRPDLRIQFGKKACEDLAKSELSPGQIKFFIKEINSKPDKKSIGWMLNRIKKTDDLSIIPDLDKIEADKIEAEKRLKDQHLIEEINAAKAAKESEKNAISFDEMHKQKLKSRGQLEFYLECRAKEKERIEKTIQKPFSEIKPLFLEYTGELIDRYSNLTDTQLLRCNEFKNFCYRNYWECLN